MRQNFVIADGLVLLRYILGCFCAVMWIWLYVTIQKYQKDPLRLSVFYPIALGVQNLIVETLLFMRYQRVLAKFSIFLSLALGIFAGIVFSLSKGLITLETLEPMWTHRMFQWEKRGLVILSALALLFSCAHILLTFITEKRPHVLNLRVDGIL